MRRKTEEGEKNGSVEGKKKNVSEEKNGRGGEKWKRGRKEENV